MVILIKSCSWNGSRRYLFQKQSIHDQNSSSLMRIVLIEQIHCFYHTSYSAWPRVKESIFYYYPVLQPLDVDVFHPFKVNLSKLTDGLKLLAVSGSYDSINKTNFTAIFKDPIDRTNCLATIKHGFRKTGIFM